MSDAPIEADLLDQTLYIAGKIYDDPGTTPIPLDLHSACAIGSYDSVYDAIAAGKNINIRNKGSPIITIHAWIGRTDPTH